MPAISEVSAEIEEDDERVVIFPKFAKIYFYNLIEIPVRPGRILKSNCARRMLSVG